MAILGKVAGPMLRDNLVRNGVDLVIDSDLTYFDVANRRVGINTVLPASDLDVRGSLFANNINSSISLCASLLSFTTIPIGFPFSSNVNLTSVEEKLINLSNQQRDLLMKLQKSIFHLVHV